MVAMTISSSQLREATELIYIDNKTAFSVNTLRDLLPDMETALFFCMVYKLRYKEMSDLLYKLFNGNVVQALRAGDHSTDLQSYIVDCVPPDVLEQAKPQFVAKPTPAEVLVELWDAVQTDVAKSIREVAEKLKGTIGRMPGKTGAMTFSHMMKLNKQRPTIGRYSAHIDHGRVAENLVILDVSGSMTEATIRTLINDVVGLSWAANAHLATVSNETHHWEPGAYDVQGVLRVAAYGGTRYETLAPLLDRDWGTVVTIADYDSSGSAKSWIAAKATGKVEQVLDISLVDRPTFLSQCIGQLAQEVRPLLVANSYRVLS